MEIGYDSEMTEESLQMYEDMMRQRKDQFYLKNAHHIIRIGTVEKIGYLQEAIDRHVTQKFGFGFGHSTGGSHYEKI